MYVLHRATADFDRRDCSALSCSTRGPARQGLGPLQSARAMYVLLVRPSCDMARRGLAGSPSLLSIRAGRVGLASTYECPARHNALLAGAALWA